jgi:hypothetical protein
MTEPTRNLLVCSAALLDQGRTVDRLSRPLTAAALIGMMVYPVITGRQPWVLFGFAMLVAVSGLVEMYFAIRVGFDAALFHQLASGPEAPDFAGMDAALARLGLLPAAKHDRPAEARVAGARRLFGFQILALAVQVLSIVIGACVALSWR